MKRLSLPVSSHGALRAWARSAIRAAGDAEYRRVSLLSARYLLYPRHRPSAIEIAGYPFAFPDAPSFLSAYEEIFVDEIYKFRAEVESPFILDLGANCGVSVVYFKLNYPGARVVALEPDALMFSYLERNVATFELGGVELHNAAAWTEDTTLRFIADGADGGRVAGAGEDGMPVRALAIRPFLDVPRIDLLKMDIEGAENSVLPACADLLGRARNVFVEYHSRAAEPQQLHRILTALAEAGFRVMINDVKHHLSPLIPTAAPGEMDLQLNIFAFRD